MTAYLRACDQWLCLHRRHVLAAEIHVPHLRAYDDWLCATRRAVLATERALA